MKRALSLALVFIMTFFAVPINTVVNAETVKAVTLSKKEYVYNGRVRKPTVTVKTKDGKKLSVGKAYTVKYSGNRKNVGTYTVKVTFKGNYSGSEKLTFKILPKAVDVKSVTAVDNSLTVKWNKLRSQVTGYQLQYGTSKKLKNAKKLTLKNNLGSAVLGNLKSGKKYYLRIRAYKTVNGKKYFSAWSDIVTKKVKASAVKSSAANASGSVWISKSGKKYHSRSSCSGMKSPSEISLSSALSQGYEPCKRCY